MEIDGIPLAELRDLAEKTATVAAAYQAGIFRGLAAGPQDSAALARRLELDGRAVRILLPVLEELGLLSREDGERYALTPATGRHLADPGSPDFEGGGLPLWLRNLHAWTLLPDVLRTGRPVDEYEEEDTSPERERERLAGFMAGMAAAPEARVRRMVRACLDRKPDASSVLDLGGGPGHISRAFVEEGLRAVLVDRPEVVEFVAEEYGLTEVDGLRLEAADFMDDPLPDGPFDVVLLGNITHIYPEEENRRLMERVREVIAPGGVVAVADFVRGRSPRAARFALVMLMRTDRGNTYSEEEYHGWLRDAGFRDPETVDVDVDRQVVTAVRPSSD
jgi:SAM-dependent methyltransferase